MRTVVMLLVAAGLSACEKKPSVKQLDARAQAAAVPYREKLEKRAAALAAVRRAAAAFHEKVPALRPKSGRPDPSFDSGSAALAFSKSQSYISRETETGLSDTVNDVLDPPHGYSPWRGSTFEEIDATVKRECESQLGRRFAVIIRVLDEQQARVTGWDTFEGGSVTADALVFDLENGELIGGYPVEGQSRSSLRTKETASNSDVEGRLNDSAMASLVSRAKSGLKEAVVAGAR